MVIRNCANRENLSDLFASMIGVDVMEFINYLENKNKHGIYKITNLITNKVYIGQTRMRFQKRYWHHQWKLRNGTHDNEHLQKSWNKYGENNFIFEVLEEVSDDSLLDNLEIKWIDYYSPNIYNIQAGGQPKNLNIFISQETRKKIGEKNRQRMLGTKLPISTRERMSEAQKGRYKPRSVDKLNEELVINIKKLLISGKTPSETSNILNVNYRHINNMISNNTWSHVFVDGWDDFLANRKTYKRLSKIDHQNIYKLYKLGKSKYELADMYNKGIKMIEKIIRDCANKSYDNPVPSSFDKEKV